MLALSRGEGQSIIIDGRIEVKIVKWSRSAVRLAIQAPREVTIDRDEIWHKMHAGQLSPLELAEQERLHRLAQTPEGQASVPPHASAPSVPSKTEGVGDQDTPPPAKP